MSDAKPFDFDMQAAWLRRFSSDVQSNVAAFAARLNEAMPELVTLRRRKKWLFGPSEVTGVSIDIGERQYSLDVSRGRLLATVAMTVHGVTLNTKQLAPADWFAQLAAETQRSVEHAKGLSRSLSEFMSS